MKTELFDYTLPPESIAQAPVEPRDASRLLVLHRATGQIEHRRFYEISDYLHAGDLLIANNSRVIPARLRARKVTGGRAEIFLLRREPETDTRWRCLVRGRNLGSGATLTILPQEIPSAALSPSTKVSAEESTPDNSPITAVILTEEPSGVRIVQFSRPISPLLDNMGQVPLPPYIHAYTGDPERYQTVFNRPEGSVAAPTAGLHFTPDLLLRLRNRQVGFETVTLHVGLDTFRPVEVEDAANHPIHSEWAELTPHTAQAINHTTLAGGRIVAVGTTSVRTLEWAATGAQQLDPYDPQACPWQRVAAFSSDVNLFIRPGYRFRAVDCLITNFHLPRSTLLMLVSAFVAQPHADNDKGRQILLAAYAEAIKLGYRFYSFGDAMLIL